MRRSLPLHDVSHLNKEVGYWKNESTIANVKLRAAEIEIERLKACIKHATKEIDEAYESCDRYEITQSALTYLNEGVSGLVTCECGKTTGHDQISWRDWKEMGMQVGECECMTTVSRVWPWPLEVK
jgi:hypothetical protein